MGKSKFKGEYRFLSKYFILATAKPSELEYKPANMDFYKDFHDHFELKITKRKETYKFRVYDGVETEIFRSEHENEEDMLASVKQYLTKMNKIGEIKNIFKP